MESDIETSYHTFDGNELFPTKIEKAARLGYGLVVNHSFIDGNKQIGVYAMISFLEVNGIVIDFTNLEVETLALYIAAGKMKYEDVLAFLRNKAKETS